MSDEHNYRWKRCYETCDGRKHWAIVSDESEANRRVCSSLLVVEHEWVDFLGRRFQDCELPQRIIALLNADESHFSRSVTKMRRYKSPENGLPYSDEGIADLEKQLHEASRAGDSALLEMAAIALRRVRVDKQQTIDALTAENAELRKLVDEEANHLPTWAATLRSGESGELFSNNREVIATELDGMCARLRTALSQKEGSDGPCLGCGGRGYWYSDDNCQVVICLSCDTGKAYNEKIAASRDAAKDSVENSMKSTLADIQRWKNQPKEPRDAQ